VVVVVAMDSSTTLPVPVLGADDDA
jgi:hypothetical protein